MVLPAGLSPATATFEASHSDILSYGSIKGFGASGETRTLVGPFARQFTKLLLSLLSHAGLENAECRMQNEGRTLRVALAPSFCTLHS